MILTHLADGSVAALSANTPDEVLDVLLASTKVALLTTCCSCSVAALIIRDVAVGRGVGGG